MRRRWRSWLATVVATAILWCLPARAQLRTCIKVEGPGASSEELARLVRLEVDRHRTHHAVENDCQSHLTVELLDLGKEGRWLTGRIDTQVPHREQVQEGELVAAAERMV